MPTLKDLVQDQPAQPGDRLASIDRKVTRIRRTRAAVSVAAVVALAVPVGALALTRHDRTPADQFTNTAVTAWPDRSVAGDTSVAKGALASYEYNANHSDQAVITDVHWLYRGTVKAPDGNDLYVAALTAKKNGVPEVVSITTRRNEVDANGLDVNDPGQVAKGISDWVAKEAPVSKTDHLGIYVEYGTAPAPNADVLFVLADPGARRMTWSQNPLPSYEEAVDVQIQKSGRVTSKDGIFFADAGPLVGTVTIALSDGQGDSHPSSDLGGQLTDPGLVTPRAVDTPSDWTMSSALNGQSERQADGRFDASPSVAVTGEKGQRHIRVYARCYGSGSVVFHLESATSGDELATTRVPCDGATHAALDHPNLSGEYAVSMTASSLVSVTYATGFVSS